MPTPDKKRRLLQVAYLCSEGFRASKIAEYLSLPSAKNVAQLLMEARQLGYLAPAPAFNAACCSEHDLKDLKNLDTSMRLSRAARKVAEAAKLPKQRWVRQIRVLPSGSWGQTPGALRHRLGSFAVALAPELLTRIAASEICGVTWGITVATAVESVGRLDPEHLLNGHRDFVAMCGEPFSMEAVFASSSGIAEQLDAMQGGHGRNVITLRGIPAFIPPDFDRGEILRFYCANTPYGEIFGRTTAGRANALISRLDTVITSVGTFETPPSTFVGELVRKSGCTQRRLAELAHGDIGGALIGRSGLEGTDAAEFERAASAWIGVSTDDLAGVVARTAGTDKPGVMVLAIGTNKTHIVSEIVRRGLVSELFIDPDLALGLGREFGVDWQRPLEKA